MIMEWRSDRVSVLSCRRRPARPAQDLHFTELSRRGSVAGLLVEGGEIVRVDAAVGPEEEHCQWEVAAKPREQGGPLVAPPDRGDDVKSRVAWQQGPCDERCRRQDSTAEPRRPRRPRRVTPDAEEPGVEPDPSQVPMCGVVLGWKGQTENHRPGHQRQGYREEDG